MVTADDILAIARKEIGVTEYPASSNNVKYNTEYYGFNVYGDDAYPWCMVFVWWVFKHANASDLFFDGNKTASCPTYYRWASKTNRWYTSNYQPGDVVIFRFSSDGYDHVGIVESANMDGSYTTIEGNTSLTSNDNGGAVMRRTRYKSQIVGAYRPKYSDTNSNMLNGCDVSEWQDPNKIKYSNYDFIVIRTSYGMGIDSEYEDHAANAKLAGKLIGFYHYAHPEINTASKEAEHFVTLVKPYLGNCILALDYEGKALAYGAEWARKWLDRVYELTGVKPLIYLQGSTVAGYQKVLDGDYGLWVAHWGVSSPSISPWPFWAMWQYSDSDGQLDVDYFNGDKDIWIKYASIQSTIPDPDIPPSQDDSSGSEEDEEMTQEQFDIMFNSAMKSYRKSLQNNVCGDWSKEDREWAISNSLIKGVGDGEDGMPNYAWRDFLTREQATTLFHRLAKYLGKE